MPELRHSGFFVLRTPLLPIEELVAWSDGLTAAKAFESGATQESVENAWKAEISILRDRLRALLGRPEVLHALYVASPSLQNGIEHWKSDPESKKGLQAERALVRYFTRMAARSTPFGLFSGCSVGQLGGATSNTLMLKPRSEYQLRCRLDFDYLFALTAALREDRALEMELRYWPNSSLHKIGDSWYYTESRMSGTERTHHLVKLVSDAYLEAVISAAENGATISQLTDGVLHAPGESDPSEEEALQYVLELIRDNEILVSDLSPLLTGAPPLDDLISQLEGLPSASTAAAILRTVRNHIGSIENTGITSSREEYGKVISELKQLPGKFDLARLFQVDMVKPAEEASLGKDVIAEVIRGVEILCRLGRFREPEELKSFRQAFSARYELALVPLLEALDDESGVGFGAAGDKNDASPLLRGLRFANGPEDSGWSGKNLGVQESIFKQVVECIRENKSELELDISELETSSEASGKLAHAFCAVGTLVARSADELRRGNFEFHVQGCVGPSGARLLGRFCHADEEIERGVREHLRQEELHDPEAIYAEIVYLPEGRVGNVLCRPVLRVYEIPYLGRSGAPANHQLPVSDLLVTVEDGSIVLYSRRLRRRVVPRLTNAHGFMNPRLSSVYRFLGSLQHQHGTSVPGFSLGALEALDYLPRVRIGKLILSLARWRLSAKEVEQLGKPEGSLRFTAVQELRRKHRLPRWVVLQEYDNYLPVDLENPLSVDALIHVMKRGSHAILTEMYPSVDQMCTTSQEGTFHHELNVPLVRGFETPIPATAEQTAKSSRREFAWTTDRQERILPPGSEWLYLKVYGGPGALDELLTRTLLPFVRPMVEAECISGWFFIRFADPHHHLRIRLKGTPEQLRQLMPLIFATFNPLLFSGELSKLEFDTYQREIERYGGVEGVLAAEEIFCADSDAVLEILQELAGDEGLDMRWRVAIMGIDRLLSDFGFGDGEKAESIRRWAEISQAEFKVRIFGKKQLAERFRNERRRLAPLLDESAESRSEWEFALRAFERRSARNRVPCAELQQMAAQGKLTQTLNDLAATYVHMHVNRLIRAEQRAHELVLYDFLNQLYEAKLARKSQSGSISPVRIEGP